MKLTDDSAHETSVLINTILTHLSAVMEGRRTRVGLAQARAEMLATTALVTEAVYFYLGGDVAKLGDVIAACTMRRLVNAKMPEFTMAADAQNELLTLLNSAYSADSADSADSDKITH